ncbi:MAG: hypothetical protein LUE11_11565 [Clostridia bacterium]|nr:hypothetical protein [Clostridia bacterium]
MTMQDIEEKYIDRTVDEDKLNYHFHMMGKFGRAFMYTFSFNTYGYTISADICVECGKITGIVPDKEEREDEWGYMPEDGSPEIQPEEYDTIARYLDSVLA